MAAGLDISSSLEGVWRIVEVVVAQSVPMHLQLCVYKTLCYYTAPDDVMADENGLTTRVIKEILSYILVTFVFDIKCNYLYNLCI